MKVPKHIKGKMHRLARIYNDANKISLEIDLYFDKKGFDIDDLWQGKDFCLEELEYGNDITEEFCKSLE